MARRGKYASRNLYEGEWIVEVAPRDVWGLVGYWILGILFCWLLVPLFVAIRETLIYTHTELVLTNRRLIAKRGIFHTKTKDIPLPKVQGCSVEITFFGKIFNVGTIYIDTEYGTMRYRIQDTEDFRTTVIGQLDQFERDRLADQSRWTAQAMLQGTRGVNPYMVGYGQPAPSRAPQNIDPYAGYGRDPFSKEEF